MQTSTAKIIVTNPKGEKKTYKVTGLAASTWFEVAADIAEVERNDDPKLNEILDKFLSVATFKSRRSARWLGGVSTDDVIKLMACFLGYKIDTEEVIRNHYYITLNEKE